MQDEDVLERLSREVLCGGPGSSLPSQLSDEWIQRAIDSIDDMINEEDQSDEACGIGMALIIKTLRDKNPDKNSIDVPLKKLCEHLELYRLELSLECLSRCSEFRSTPATLETIFEPDRQVEVTRRLECSVVEGSDSVQ